MKQLKFNVNIKYDSFNEDFKFSTIEELCSFLNITKSQYIGLVTQRTKNKRMYNQHLATVTITKLPIIKEKTKERPKVVVSEFIDMIINKAMNNLQQPILTN